MARRRLAWTLAWTVDSGLSTERPYSAVRCFFRGPTASLSLRPFPGRRPLRCGSAGGNWFLGRAGEFVMEWSFVRPAPRSGMLVMNG